MVDLVDMPSRMQLGAQTMLPACAHELLGIIRCQSVGLYVCKILGSLQMTQVTHLYKNLLACISQWP